MCVASMLVMVWSALPFALLNSTRSPTCIGLVSPTVSATSQGEFVGSRTDCPLSAIVPAIVAFTGGAGGGAWKITGWNSSTVMIVTVSVDEFLMTGPS